VLHVARFQARHFISVVETALHEGMKKRMGSYHSAVAFLDGQPEKLEINGIAGWTVGTVPT
jgi:hypothetical protein